jgi:hypothetical protein
MTNETIQTIRSRRTRKGPIHAAPITLSDKTELLNKPKM